MCLCKTTPSKQKAVFLYFLFHFTTTLAAHMCISRYIIYIHVYLLFLMHVVAVIALAMRMTIVLIANREMPKWVLFFFWWLALLLPTQTVRYTISASFCTLPGAIDRMKQWSKAVCMSARMSGSHRTRISDIKLPIRFTSFKWILLAKDKIKQWFVGMAWHGMGWKSMRSQLNWLNILMMIYNNINNIFFFA